jgi:hypothetical protein
MWLFSDMVSRAFPNFLFPLLGLIFLPFTAVMYVLAFQGPLGMSGFGWLLVAIGLILDISTYGGGLWGNRDRWRGRR